MTKTAKSILFLATVIFLYGCPYSSPYSIDAEPQQYIDEGLLGKWATMVQRPSYEGHYREAPVKVIFEKRTEMEYDIAITGYINELKPFRVIENDTIKGTGFLSTVNNRILLNSFIGGRYYIAEVIKDKNNVSILALAEQFTNKYVKSSAVLRSTIDVHYHTRVNPSYDDWFVLKNLQKVN